MTKRLLKKDVVVIEGRRWFEKTNGNTYHSVYLYVNNDLIDSINFTYGYGDMYQQNGRALLNKHYNLKLENFRDDKKFNIRYDVIDVPRKKDL